MPQNLGGRTTCRGLVPLGRRGGSCGVAGAAEDQHPGGLFRIVGAPAEPAPELEIEKAIPRADVAGKAEAFLPARPPRQAAGQAGPRTRARPAREPLRRVMRLGRPCELRIPMSPGWLAGQKVDGGRATALPRKTARKRTTWQELACRDWVHALADLRGLRLRGRFAVPSAGPAAGAACACSFSAVWDSRAVSAFSMVSRSTSPQ